MEEHVLNYRILIEPEKYPDGSLVYAAYCPTLGIADYGDTIEEVMKSMKDGIELAVETLVQEKKDVPQDNVQSQILATASITVPKHYRTPVSP